MGKLNLMQKSQKNKFDNLYTPSDCLCELYELLFHRLHIKKHYTIWECCDNSSSQITEFFQKKGFKVLASDVRASTNELNYHHLHNFLEENSFDENVLKKVDNELFIITNPPYSLKDDFIQRAINYLENKKIQGFAYLLPLTCLEGKRRHNLFKKINDLGFSICFGSYDKRINFTTNKNNYFSTGWLIVFKSKEKSANRLEFLEYKGHDND